MTGYYDIVLGVIPVALVGITALLVTVGLPIMAAVGGAAAVTVAVMGHALFVRSPIPTDEPTVVQT